MISSYVIQDGQLFPMLTVFQTMFVAKVRLPLSLSRAGKKKRVHELFEQLSLQSATHIYWRQQTDRHVGGRTKRVSIGVDIIHKPFFIFLDGPTPSLDSNSDCSVVKKVKDIFRNENTVFLSVSKCSSTVSPSLQGEDCYTQEAQLHSQITFLVLADQSQMEKEA